MRSGSICKNCCFTMKDYDRTANNSEVCGLLICKAREQRAFANLEFIAERKTCISSVIRKGEGDEEEKIWLARVRLLCLCFVKGDKKKVGQALMQYKKCVSLLNAADEALR